MVPVAPNRFRVGALEIVAERETSEEPFRLIVKSSREGRAQIFSAKAELRMSPAKRQEYLGTYRSDEIDGQYQIVEEGFFLALKRPKYPVDRLAPTIPDYFSGGPGSLHFLRNANGDVTGFLVRTGRIRNLEFKKVE